jgi:hypothetical protein
MNELNDLTKLDDPDLIDERAKLRDTLERLPAGATNRPTLVERYDQLTEEFDRRARTAWASASKGGEA